MTSDRPRLITEADPGLARSMREWRHAIHAHPETAFEEIETAAMVARQLGECGLEVHTGIAQTGVVGVLSCGSSSRAIGLRADMDALHIQEQNDFAHRSLRDGRMHACGHDGHTAMLLGAARHLASTRSFDGTVYFIFQPAEENEGGGRRMVEEGLFERFAMEAVFGLHNIPGMPVGQFTILTGPALASFDIFEITVRGRGGHAAMPQRTVDPIVAGSQLVTALQSIVSRTIDPLDAGVVSVTSLHAGETWNVVPDTCVIRGSVRAFSESVRNSVEARMRELAAGICAAFGARADVRYERRYPATVNAPAESEHARRVAVRAFGSERIVAEGRPLMASEDFAYMLQAKPGCFALTGNGTGVPGSPCELHNPRYDFNDDVLGWGATYWVRLVEETLAKP
jgi:amidohydrolase